MEEKTPDQTTIQPPPNTPVVPQPASSPLPQNIYPSPRHFPKNAIFAITLLFILLLIFGTTWAFKDQIFKPPTLQPSPTPEVSKTVPPTNPTADWKTYRNEEYGFEFKYPETWSTQNVSSEKNLMFKGLREGNGVKLALLSDYNPGSQKITPYIPQDHVEFIRYEKDSNYNFDDILNVYNALAPEISNRQIDNHNGVFIYHNGAASGDSVVIFIEYGKYVYVITDTENALGIPDDKEIFDQILSTFKFIDSPTTGKLQICPDKWYENRMPGSAKESSEMRTPNQYFIIDGKRRELTEFDVEWIKTNCEVTTPQPVY